MSALMIHAQAARILADAFHGEGENGTDRPESSELLHLIGDAYRTAADRMEQAVRDQLAAVPGGCTLDHARLTAPKCPACGAPKPGR